jgi:two-component system chemotaxis response regulator CheY
MLVIDEGADVKLVKALEGMRTNAAEIRCLHFNIAASPMYTVYVQNSRKAIIVMIEEALGKEDQQIYFCDDGDIFIFGTKISARGAMTLISMLAAELKTAPSANFANLYQVENHITKLLFMVEQKIELKRNLAEAQYKEKLEKLQAQKRADILNTKLQSNKENTIAQRRRERAKPELMIIEDDAFSRRLVENVLQKKFNLTQLGIADLALATYAHIAPDLVFLDIDLPDVTGHDLLKKIIEIDPEAYVIMLSGNADKENIMQAMQNGAKGFVAKPFTRDKIFQYIERCPTIKKEEVI